MMMKKIVRVGVLLGLMSLLGACAGLGQMPEAPKLSVVEVKPVKLRMNNQVFRFELNAFNPNGFKLPVKGVDFVARFSGVEVGQGATDQAVTLTPNADTKFSIDVNTDLSKVVTNIGDLFKAGSLNLDYELDGKMRFLDAALFDNVGLPFNLKGNLLD